MQQVTRRGLLQAGLCCVVAAAAAIIPLELAPALSLFHTRIDPDIQAKIRLSKFISETYKQPLALIRRIVEASFLQAAATQMSPMLILSVVAKESSFSPTAYSSYGAKGLMQVVPRFHQEEVSSIRHPAGLLHPESNISAGSKILRKYLKSSKGNIPAALKKYSGGARQYSERVAKHWAEFALIAHPYKLR